MKNQSGHRNCRHSAIALLFCALCTLLSAAESHPLWRQTVTVDTPATVELRGFGKVVTHFEEYTNPSGAQCWVMQFNCQNSEKASTLIGKYLADLQQSPEATPQAMRVAEGRDIPVVIISEGALAAFVDGAVGRVVGASSFDSLRDFLTAMPALSDGAVDHATYPVYLDRFDRWGWGFYGMGEYRNIHNWMQLGKGNTEIKNPIEDVDFLAQQKIRFEGHLDSCNMDTSDGIMQNTGVDWMVKETQKRGMPISFRVYANAGGADWTARRFGEYAEQPAPFVMSAWIRSDEFNRAAPHLTWFDKDIQRYMAAKTMQMMRKFNDEPNIAGWMQPHGELLHEPWYDLHDDYSPVARENWHNYLQKKGISLKEISRMLGMEDQPVSNWEQVPIPEFATFCGLSQQILDLGGEWLYRQDNNGTPLTDEFWKQTDQQRYTGVKESWWNAPIDMTEWKTIHAPGTELLRVFPTKPDANAASTWFRKQFLTTPSMLPAGKKIYLYWFPISFDGIHTGERKRYHEVYLNGKLAGKIGVWGAIDVTDQLRCGENQLALHLLGSLWNGRVFLSTEEPSVFPYLGKDRNRLWILWREWHLDAKYNAWADILDGMRQVDPNRPIKFMAPIGFGAERWLSLATRFGGWAHFTGEGMWYFPWYKRYGFLYGVEGTSELAGPADVSGLYAAMRRTFLAGLNGHEPVFQAQTYTRNPESRQWLIDHDAVIHRMGTYDLAGQQVLIYRRSNVISSVYPAYPTVGIGSREIQNSWNWDIGRGTLQTIGQSYVYLDDCGLRDGKMYGYKVMMDCGNETMPEESVDNLEQWVRAGGTFITYPFTGRNSMLEPDSWPILKLTGCAISKMRKPGEGKIKILPTQSVFRDLAGQTFDDNGSSMDWQGGEHNLLSTELQPGDDCEILATFDNGKPAIVKRRLGKGAVIVMGSAFWRSAHDVQGVWWIKPIETRFIADLLNGVGYPAAPCTTDDPMVWPQPYRSNNGVDDITVLVNWHEEGTRQINVTLRLPQKPSTLVCYGVDGIQKLPFEWNDGKATVKVTMPAKEVKILSAPTHPLPNALAHWWNRAQRYWQPTERPHVDFSPYTRGKWADPTFDLSEDARLSTSTPTTDDWTSPSFNDATWTPCRLGVLTITNNIKPNTPVWVRKTFRVPAEWASQGGKIYLTSGSWAGPNYLDKTRLYLNGTMLRDYNQDPYIEIDVTRMLLDRDNTLCFQTKGESNESGFQGVVYLYHRAAPALSVDLGGRWTGTNKAGETQAIQLPGKGQTTAPARTVLIPKEWAGKYRIRFYANEEGRQVIGVRVNGVLVRRHHHVFGTRCDLDITNHLQFGKENTLTLEYTWSGVRDLSVTDLRLDLFGDKQ